jgi:hypothetical protein
MQKVPLLRIPAPIFSPFRIRFRRFYSRVTIVPCTPRNVPTLISPLDGRASFNTIEVSEFTGMKPKTIRKYAAAGYIPGAFHRLASGPAGDSRGKN